MKLEWTDWGNGLVGFRATAPFEVDGIRYVPPQLRRTGRAGGGGFFSIKGQYGGGWTYDGTTPLYVLGEVIAPPPREVPSLEMLRRSP